MTVTAVLVFVLQGLAAIVLGLLLCYLVGRMIGLGVMRSILQLLKQHPNKGS